MKIFKICPIREQDGQASGGNDFGSDDWIFTIREKDPKKLQNGEGQSGAADQVRVPEAVFIPHDGEQVCRRPHVFLVSQTKDIPKRPYSQSLATVISPALAEVRSSMTLVLPQPPQVLPSPHLLPCFQLKARQEQVNGNPMVLDELREAILLAEEAYPGISDSLVAHMVHRLQR